MPIVFPSKDTDSVVSAFLSDVHSRMPCICGSEIKFSDKPLVLFANLQPANAISQHPNARATPVRPTLQRIKSSTSLLKNGSQTQAYSQNGLETAVSQVVPSLSSTHVLPRAASNPVVPSSARGQTTSGSHAACACFPVSYTMQTSSRVTITSLRKLKLVGPLLLSLFHHLDRDNLHLYVASSRSPHTLVVRDLLVRTTIPSVLCTYAYQELWRH